MAERVDLTAGQNVPIAAGTVQTCACSSRGHARSTSSPCCSTSGARSGRTLTSSSTTLLATRAAPSRSTEQALSLDLASRSGGVERVIVAANRDGDGRLDGLTVLVEGDEQLTFAPSSLAGLPTAVLLEVYRRGGGWRVRAVGQGWAAGLAGLAREYGVNVD